MRLRISPDLDLFLDMELQGVSDSTRDEDIQLYKDIVTEAFMQRLRQAFSEDEIRLYSIDFHVANRTKAQAA